VREKGERVLAQRGKCKGQRKESNGREYTASSQKLPALWLSKDDAKRGLSCSLEIPEL